MPIVPDTKNWTWVLERPCPECGFDATTFGHDDVPRLVAENAAGWAEVMQRGDLARRPSDDRWSALEYACHVRDVYRLFQLRLGLMLDENEPQFANWNQDDTALAERYGEQDPATVSIELADAAAEVAAAFAAVEGEQWSRTGVRSDGAIFTVDTLARYFVHDPIHHLWDVGA